MAKEYLSEIMRSYLKDISSKPLITTTEEKELAVDIANGSEDAKKKLIEANLRLVVKIARDFDWSSKPLEERVSTGNLGLERAAEDFDPNKGAKFSTYASRWIKQAIRRELIEEGDTIRVPGSSKRHINKAKKFYDEGKEVEEIAEIMGKRVSTIERYMISSQITKGTYSLNKIISEGGEETFMSRVISNYDDDIFLDTDELRFMRKSYEKLEDREQLVISLRYGLNGKPPMTLEEISNKIDRTRERVRQIQNRALGKMKKIIANSIEQGEFMGSEYSEKQYSD